MSRPVRQVLIVGRDAAAWLTALALQRAFGRTGVTVRVVETPSLLGSADVYAAVPSLTALHGLLGLKDHEVLAATSGVPVLGQRFSNWSGAARPFVHGYDTQRVAIDDLDFLQYWVKARGEGLRVELEDFSLAAAAARQGRSPVEADGTQVETPVAPGWHFDALAYVDLVRRRALAAGVEGRAARVRAVNREEDRIVSVTLDDGLTVAADLFLDASGVEAVLIGDSPGAAFESWRDQFRADRILVASAAVLKPLPGHSEIAAFSAGWLGLFPLRDRTAITAVYDSAVMSDREVAEAIPVLCGRPITGEVTVEPFAPGLRPAWSGNCVAIGTSAVALEPLDAIQLHLIHTGLSHLIALFPVDADQMPEAPVFNAGFASHVRNIRDFQLAHYALNRRYDEPFWDRARDAPATERLAERLRLFEARGTVAIYDDESFQEQNWTSIFVGHGLIPRSWSPLVDRTPAEEQMAKFRGLLARVAEEVRAMPEVESQFGAEAQ